MEFKSLGASFQLTIYSSQATASAPTSPITRISLSNGEQIHDMYGLKPPS